MKTNDIKKAITDKLKTGNEDVAEKVSTIVSDEILEARVQTIRKAVGVRDEIEKAYGKIKGTTTYDEKSDPVSTTFNDDENKKRKHFMKKMESFDRLVDQALGEGNQDAYDKLDKIKSE